MKDIISELKNAREKCANNCDKEILIKILDEQIPELERLSKLEKFSKEKSGAEYIRLVERMVKIAAVVRFIWDRFTDE